MRPSIQNCHPRPPASTARVPLCAYFYSCSTETHTHNSTSNNWLDVFCLTCRGHQGRKWKSINPDPLAMLLHPRDSFNTWLCTKIASTLLTLSALSRRRPSFCCLYPTRIKRLESHKYALHNPLMQHAYTSCSHAIGCIKALLSSTPVKHRCERVILYISPSVTIRWIGLALHKSI
jgi:hypothetical protein